jgi:hypothetical protein
MQGVTISSILERLTSCGCRLWSSQQPQQSLWKCYAVVKIQQSQGRQMPPKSQKIPPPVATIDKLDNLLTAPRKFIEDDLGIKLPRIAPDTKKLSQEITKAKKPAEFYILLDGEKFGFEVRVGTYRQNLGQVNLGAEKDNDVRFEIMRALTNQTTLFTQKELDSFNQKHLTSAQTGYYHGQVAEYERKVEELRKLTQALAHPTYEHLDPIISADFHDWARAHSTLHYVTFLEDLDAKGDARTIFDKYIKTGAQYPVNVGEHIGAEIEKALSRNQAPDFNAARTKVVKVVNTALLPTFKKLKLPAYQKELDHDSAYLESVKKQLKDAGVG